jgi:DNA-binding NarL/FixJ family response regulator
MSGRAKVTRSWRLDPGVILHRHIPPGTQWTRVAHHLGLSARQADVVHLLLSSMTIRGAADELGLRPDTVKTYLKRTYQRLEISSRLELAIRILAAAADLDAGTGDTRAGGLNPESGRR